eukprot:gene18554-biopygen890
MHVAFASRSDGERLSRGGPSVGGGGYPNGGNERECRGTSSAPPFACVPIGERDAWSSPDCTGRLPAFRAGATPHPRAACCARASARGRRQLLCRHRCPCHRALPRAGETGQARTTPTPPQAKRDYSPRHARAMPAPRSRQCPVPPGGCGAVRGEAEQEEAGVVESSAYPGSNRPPKRGGP